MPLQQISRGNDVYDALPSSAHPMFLDNGTTQRKTVFVQPRLIDNRIKMPKGGVDVGALFTLDRHSCFY